MMEKCRKTEGPQMREEGTNESKQRLGQMREDIEGATWEKTELE